jgi:pyruvate dehydrogenase E1 component alpha subunit
VYEATKRAAAQCRAGKGPYLLELLTYRRTGHSRRDPTHYQPKDEKQTWFARDPIDRFATQLESEGLIDAAGVKRLRDEVTKRFEAAVEGARQAKQPTLADLETDVFAEKEVA